jgi:hypothetical protein
MQKNSRLQSHSECTYICEVCQPIDDYNQGCIGSHGTFKNLTTILESIICPWDQFLEWHGRECLRGNYNICGVDNMVISPIEVDGSSTSLMKWK